MLASEPDRNSICIFSYLGAFFAPQKTGLCGGSVPARCAATEATCGGPAPPIPCAVSTPGKPEVGLVPICIQTWRFTFGKPPEIHPLSQIDDHSILFDLFVSMHVI
jgi:hypothetical protein